VVIEDGQDPRAVNLLEELHAAQLRSA
jgi:hypothetical protein